MILDDTEIKKAFDADEPEELFKRLRELNKITFDQDVRILFASACGHNKYKIVLHFLMYPDPVENLSTGDQTGNRPIRNAIKNNDLKMLNILVNKGFDPAGTNHFIVLEAIAENRLEIVKYLLTAPGVFPAFGHNALLKAAIKINNIEMTELIGSNKKVIEYAVNHNQEELFPHIPNIAIFIF